MIGKFICLAVIALIWHYFIFDLTVWHISAAVIYMIGSEMDRKPTGRE